MTSSEIIIKEFKEFNLEEGYLIDGFPSVGLTSAIATESMIHTSQFELGGIIDSKNFPPISVIKEGKPNHPSRIFINEDLKGKNLNAIKCHRIIDGGKDNIGNDIVVSGEGTGIVHIATGCGSIDNKIGKKEGLVEIAPLNDEARYLSGFGFLTDQLATSEETRDKIIDYLKDQGFLLYQLQKFFL